MPEIDIVLQSNPRHVTCVMIIVVLRRAVFDMMYAYALEIDFLAQVKDRFEASFEVMP